MDKQIVVYKASDGNELLVRTDGETVWMTIEQMVKLFGRDRTVLVRHVNSAIREGELRRVLMCKICTIFSPVEVAQN